MKNSSRSIAFPASQPTRGGKVLAMFAILLPTLLAVVGLMLDGGDLLNEYRVAQHAADAAASAAAQSYHEGASVADATTIAEQYVQNYNNLGSANVTVSIPPISGPLTGDARSVEVEVVQPSSPQFLAFLGTNSIPQVRTRAVARFEPSTAGAALVVLDPDPDSLAIPAVGAVLPALPSLVAGLEIIGTSRVRVDGAIHVNTNWGGVDENGDPAGESSGLRTAVAAPLALMSEQVQALDFRVVGGVDDQDNYGHFTGGEPTPLKANQLPVDDPLLSVPVPTTISDPTNVSATFHGGMTIADIPLISPPRTINPGVYDYLQIISGNVTLSPGVYVIRGVHPVTGIGLSILGGTVTADGVMFYLTNTTGYAVGSGVPDNADGETVPPSGLGTLIPSAVIAAVLPGCTFRGLNDASSPFDGMFIFQRRADRRPVAIVNNLLLGGRPVEGTIYAKWGHIILSGSGFEETTAVGGTLRLINVTNSLIAPSDLLPPAEDVFLVE